MLYKKILETIKQNSLIPKGATVIAALSGGADSVCLTDVLYNIKDELGFCLECAHVNHNLRGEESDSDEQFVREFCQRLGIRLHVKSVDVMAMAQGRSIEDAAREARYEFFKELSANDNIYIATAHTLNDNAETFFINLLRGSGGRGLCGIPQRRQNIIRPLLGIKREEITEHLKSKGYRYCTDSTNADTDFLRNFIRHKILPQFAGRDDTDVFKAILKATENLKRDNEAIEMQAESVTELKTDVLKTLPDAVLFRVIARKLECDFKIAADTVIFNKIKALLSKPSSKEQIRANIFAKNRSGYIEFVKIDQKNTDTLPLSEGENFFAKKIILIKKTKEVYSTLTKASVNCDKIENTLTARTRRDGDTFISTKRKCTTKLKKLLINDKVPQEQRDSLTVICDGDNIVFVEGYGADARYASDKYDKNNFSIEIKGKQNDK